MLCDVRNNSSSWLTLTAFGVLTLACSDRDVSTDTSMGPTTALNGESNWENVKAFTVERSDEFMIFMGRSIEDIDRGLEALADRGGERWELDKDVLDAKRSALADQFERLGDASGSTWNAAKERTVELYEDLRDSIRSSDANTAR